MKIQKDGHVFETDNAFVIEQMLKHGGVEVKAEAPKAESTKKAKKD